MSIPSRWHRYVLDVATRPGPLQARAEKEIQDHEASRKRKAKKTLPRRKAERTEHQAATGARAALRQAVATRAGGLCECCGADITIEAGELDHFFGRARSENVETCWFLCPACHRLKTNNTPNRRWWLERFRRHAIRHGYGRPIPMLDAQLALEPAPPQPVPEEGNALAGSSSGTASSRGTP